MKAARLLLLWSALLVSALAQSPPEPVAAPPPPPPPPQWKVTVECQMVVLPEKTVLALLPELHDPAKIEAAFAKVQEQIAKGEAELAANLVVQTHEGGRAVAETIEELRYPTEFDPPNLPQNAPERIEVLREWPVAGITPTAFETRNVGTVLEVVCSPLAEGRLWQVMAMPQHVRFLRWAKTDAGRLANGERLSVEQPIFYTIKNSSQVVLAPGQRVLLGVHKLVEPTKKLELFFLKLTAAPAKAP